MISNAKMLGYKPNSAARNLRLNRTGAVGFHIQRNASLSSAYMMEFLRGAAEGAHAEDYDLVLLAAGASERLKTSPSVDGIIIADPFSTDPAARTLLDTGITVVSGEACPPGLETAATVRADHEGGLTQILDHLYSRGARSIGLLAAGDHSGWGIEVRRTYNHWAEQHDLTKVIVEIPPVDNRLAYSISAGHEMLRTHPTLDAIITTTVGSAKAIAEFASAAGRQVGADLLLAACLDTGDNESERTITALDVQPHELGRRCAATLISLIVGGSSVPATQLVSTNVRIRPSTLGS
ncbi:DNA-binding transcriptional regulator, LacI/PurR family [Rhodococcoides kyotonense]|uniref:DNA-binding transcriptional regulator, LacI/PurR family n=1 Tax=Rhodococcoides kyotonense TaxID=398843 RepID=A0A239N344_9NOCA|nr:DNA-binding transcriptional regulator, LacI/PurR family [Rhodococcus kyotonensis]